MKVCVVGCGAIGGWIAGALADAGAEVSLFARGGVLQALRSDGLVVIRTGREARYRLAASDDADALPKPDYVFLAVKGQNVPDVAPVVARLCTADTAVVPAVNGIPWWFFLVPGVALEGTSLSSVDPEGATARAVPVARVIGCVVHASASSPRPGVVDVRGEDRLLLGEPDGQTTERVAVLCQMLEGTTVNPAASADIRSDIWAKLWGNMTMNPLSVLTGAGTGAMLDDPDVRDLVRAMMEEMREMGAKIGLPLTMTPDERMTVTRRLGDIRTSMLQDALVDRPLETGPILGALVEIADQLGQFVPFIRSVHGLLRVRAKAQATAARRARD